MEDAAGRAALNAEVVVRPTSASARVHSDMQIPGCVVRSGIATVVESVHASERASMYDFGGLCLAIAQPTTLHALRHQVG